MGKYLKVIGYYGNGSDRKIKKQDIDKFLRRIDRKIDVLNKRDIGVHKKLNKR